MNPSFKSLRSEKLTFIIVICIMLFSMIYMSSYSLLMKSKIDHFQQDIQVMTKEMNVLLKYLPEKDSVILIQKEKIIAQMQEVQAEITKNQTSETERKKLISKLLELRNEVEKLSLEAIERTNPVLAIEELEENPLEPLHTAKKDNLLQAKENEIARLKATIAELESRQSPVIIHNKLAVYYFTAISSDKRNRASKTNSLKIQLQLKGNMDQLQDKYLYIEVRDPLHKIISRPQDKIRIINHFKSEYNFEPFNYNFIKGKYSVRIYSEEAQFQSITFLTLN